MFFELKVNFRRYSDNTKLLFGQDYQQITNRCVDKNVLLFHKEAPAHPQRGLEVICPQRSHCPSLVVGLPNRVVDLRISSGHFPTGQNRKYDRQSFKPNQKLIDQQEIISLPKCSERNHLLLQGWSDGKLFS